MGPDQTAPDRPCSLIRVHSVCFHDIKSIIINICSRQKKETSFSGQKILAGLGLRKEFGVNKWSTTEAGHLKSLI